MLKRRIIPKILIEERVVGGALEFVSITTQRFSSVRVVGDPISQAKLFESQLADELVVLRRDGSQSGISEGFRTLLSRLANESFMPLAVGGGIDSVDKANCLISAGADKVIVGSAALTDSTLLSSIASRFGSQSIVVSLDIVSHGSDEYNVMTGAARSQVAGDLDDILSRCVSQGAGEILLTDITRDGLGEGLNLSLGAYTTERIGIPVILSGGAGTPLHFGEAFQFASVDAVSAGTFFSRRDQTPIEVRAHMMNSGIPTRNIT